MRNAEIRRKTAETEVHVELDLDGAGRHGVSTGIGFLDHMLGALAFHGLFDLTLDARGDLHIDAHHTTEDCALALGQAFDHALGDHKGIVRMGSATVPMDEALAMAVVDLSGRPYAVVDATWHAPAVGGLPTGLIGHFIESFAVGARANVHARVMYGREDHHQAEALFKALARALDVATAFDPRRSDTVPSTKGTVV